MLQIIKTFFKHILTENDNETYEIVRTLWAISVLLGLSLEVANVFWAYKFDLQAYGVGVGSLLGAGGVVTALKSHVENGAKVAV